MPKQSKGKKKSLVGWMNLGEDRYLKFDIGCFSELITPHIYKNPRSWRFHEDRKYNSPVKVRITIQEL